MTHQENVRAQKSKMDSLISILKKPNSDSLIADAYIQLFFLNEFSDSTSVVKYLKEYETFAHSKSNKKELANVFRLYGFFNDDHGLYPEAIKSYEKSLKYSKEIGKFRM